MQIRLSSGGCRIVDSRQVFLLREDEDLTMEVLAEDGFRFSLVLRFKEDDAGAYRIEPEQTGEHVICLTCWNFEAQGTGLTEPVRIAEIEGRELLILFWSYLEGAEKGKSKVRSVKYTLFMRGDLGEREHGK